MSKQDFTHTIDLPVRWRDLDALGHVNNATYFTYLELGRVEYCDKILNIKFSPETKAAWVLADIQCSYRQQIHYPETLEICTRIRKLSNKSAKLSAHIYRKDGTDAVATSEAVIVWFNFEEQQAKRIPDSIRQAITDFENSVEIS